MLYKLLVFIVIFIYFNPLRVKFFPVDTGVLLSFLGLLYIVFVKKRIDHLSLRIIYLSIVLIFYSLCVSIISQTFDFSVLIRSFSIITYVFSAILVVDLIAKSYDNFRAYYVLDWIIYVFSFQAFISLLLFFIPSLKEAFLNILDFKSAVMGDIMENESKFRLISVSKIQYATMSLLYGIALIAYIVRFYANGERLCGSKLLTCLCVGLLLIAGILTARTFFVILGLVFFYVLILKYKKSGIKAVFVILGLCIVILISLGLLLELLEDSEYGFTYKWAFEWYINLSESGSLETDSTDSLFGMYNILPKEWVTLLFGDGRYILPNGSPYMGVDIGFYRNIFYWGILGSILYYYVQYRYYKMLTLHLCDRELKDFSKMIIITFFVYSFKETWEPIMFWPILAAVISKSKLCSLSDQGTTMNV